MDAINGWFELSYASYMTLPRVVLEAMPDDWQERFVAMLGELDEVFDLKECQYEVRKRDKRGRYLADPLADYRHPHREVLDSIRRVTS